MEEVIISPFIPFLFLLIYKNKYSQIITIGTGTDTLSSTGER